MAELLLVGDVAGAGTLTATVTYLDDYRDPDGRLPPPVLLFRRLPGQPWAAYPSGGPATVLGPDAPGQPVPRVRVTYTVLQAGLPPFSRTVERRVLPNTELAGLWDFTRPDAEQPSWGGGGGTPTPVAVQPGQGPPGERGPGLLSGEGVPGAGLGQPGDSYIDTLTWDFHVRTGGAWTLTGNIKGGTGGIGGQGEPGVDGKSFPAPLESQEGYLPIADGTGPHGFSWRPKADLGVRLRDLGDVDVAGLADGQVLAWNAAARRWKPVAMGTGGGGGENPEPPEVIALQNGVPVPVPPMAEGAQAAYTMELPTGMTTLTVATSGGTGDVDILVRHGQPPVLQENGPPLADGDSAEVGNAETVTITDPASGTWYVLLLAYEVTDGVTITATWDADSGGGEPFTVATDTDGYQTITNADATTDQDGYQTIPDATATTDPDGYESVERSS